MFSVPEVFEYYKDKPFFHYFCGTVSPLEHYSVAGGLKNVLFRNRLVCLDFALTKMRKQTRSSRKSPTGLDVTVS